MTASACALVSLAGNNLIPGIASLYLILAIISRAPRHLREMNINEQPQPIVTM